MSLILIAILCYSGYRGNEVWCVETDVLGLGNIKFSHLIAVAIGVFANLQTLCSVSTNLWSIRNSSHFKLVYRGNKSIFCHSSFIFVHFLIFLGYSLLSTSTLIYDHTILYLLAFGAHYLQATMRSTVASISKENF